MSAMKHLAAALPDHRRQQAMRVRMREVARTLGAARAWIADTASPSDEGAMKLVDALDDAINICTDAAS